MSRVFALKGDIAYSVSIDEIRTVEDGYVVCNNGLCDGVFKSLPKRYEGIKVYDYSHKLIIPGLVDLHIHAPQFAFRGTNMDLELMDWLNQYTFVEEAKYSDLVYARKAYEIFARALKKSASTRFSIFATMHRAATGILMEEMEKTGLISYVGKINMDSNAPDNLLEENFDRSAYDTFGWLNETMKRFKRTMPILTPRFIPSCSEELLNELREIKHTYDLPVQSHLSENPGEISFVKELRPESKFYGDAYDAYDLFDDKTIMAHCVYSTDDELALIKNNGVMIAHCPSSNLNLSSGIAPIKKYLEMGLKVGLGSDVAGGESESLFEEIKKAIEVSKMSWRYLDSNYSALSFKEAFYLATLGGGQFFGKVGSFLKDYEFDAVVIDDSLEPTSVKMSVNERLERSVYLNLDKRGIKGKFVDGRKIIG